ASVIFALGFYAAYWSIGKAPDVRPLYFGTSVSTIIIGLLMIVTRKKIITHVIGFMLIENGIFCLALSIAKEMPFIVALGVLLDLFIAVYLFGLFINKIHDTFAETDVQTLSHLKD
ncbi:MAG TPA: hydrogenase, partial [Desulfobacteraceae bacterium]|nr:hydrogenase [Desulfobacteraceae bacterium]